MFGSEHRKALPVGVVKAMLIAHRRLVLRDLRSVPQPVARRRRAPHSYAFHKKTVSETGT